MDYVYSESSYDLLAGMKINEEGSIYAVCNSLQANEQYDIKFFAVDVGGVLITESYFDGRDEDDDYCYGLALDTLGNSYVCGASTNSGSKDFVLIKFLENGDEDWVALYDYNQLDDIAMDLLLFEDKIIIAGNSKDSTSNKNCIVTIAYDYDGKLEWHSKYSSINSENDSLAQLITNGNENFLLIGNILVEGQTFNVNVFSYSTDGIVSDILLHEGESNEEDFCTGVTIDHLGNIYAAIQSIVSDEIKYHLIKINQPHIFKLRLKDYLKTLSIGLLPISSDERVRVFVYDYFQNVIDSSFKIGYDSLIEISQSYIDLKNEMNSNISTFYSIPMQDHVQQIFNRFWVLGRKQMPFIAVPHFHHLVQGELDSIPKIAYSYFDTSYPISCLNCNEDQIQASEAELTPTWITAVGLPPWYYINGNPLVYITNCTAVLSSVEEACHVCSASTPGQIGALTNSGVADYEIGIDIARDDIMQDDQCYFISPTQTYYPFTFNPIAFARLSKVNNSLPYYEMRGETSGYPPGVTVLKKVTHPIRDRLYHYSSTGINNFANPLNWKDGDVLSLCATQTKFNDFQEVNEQFALAYGLYRLDRPGINQKPVYFAFPHSYGIWFTDGPDMSVVYNLDVPLDFCTNGKWEVVEDYSTRRCRFCITGPLVLSSISTSNVRDYLATTDLQTIEDYWSSNVITVGLCKGAGSIPPGTTNTPGINVHVFTAISNPTPPTPPSGTTIAELDLSSSGEYMITKNFSSGVNAGQNLWLCLKANYEDGTSIDECRQITLVQNSTINPGLPFTYVTVDIRGNIKNYNSSIINYKLSIIY